MIKPDPTCFLIADISGYTEYLSGVEIDHAQDILADAIIEKIVDWRPYDYLTEESKMFADGPTLLTTIELKPTAEGTTVHYRFAQPKKAKDRQALQATGPIDFSA